MALHWTVMPMLILFTGDRSYARAIHAHHTMLSNRSGPWHGTARRGMAQQARTRVTLHDGIHHVPCMVLVPCHPRLGEQPQTYGKWSGCACIHTVCYVADRV